MKNLRVSSSGEIGGVGYTVRREVSEYAGWEARGNKWVAG